jgi:hypothetical protein
LNIINFQPTLTKRSIESSSNSDLLRRHPIYKRTFLFLYLTSTAIYASNIEKLANKLELKAGTKASVQWERIFSSPRHLQKYNLDSLSQQARDELRVYLLQHAADSEHPIVPGLSL